jgi:hypothetical protein
MPDSEILPRVAYLRGCDSESASPAVRLLDQIGEIFDRSYGELVVFDDRGNESEPWDFSATIRYRLVEGKLTNEKP